MRPVCAFDLDHTLVRSSLDLGAMKAEVRALVATRGPALPSTSSCEPGAPDALAELRAGGFPLAVWTNNVRRVAEDALARCGLRAFFAAVVTRDEAALKPDPAGLRLLEHAFPERRIWVVGDSWVDGAAAQAGGAAFVAYRADPVELARRGVAPRVVLEDLRRLPAWIREASS
jgi:phosphoglycolate phosphatase